MGHFPVYQVLLRGPTKIEYLFLDQAQEPMPPVMPSATTLVAIDTHFWDWIWWLATKTAAGRDELASEHLPQLHCHLLQPLGVATAPTSISTARPAGRRPGQRPPQWRPGQGRAQRWRRQRRDRLPRPPARERPLRQGRRRPHTRADRNDKLIGCEQVSRAG